MAYAKKRVIAIRTPIVDSVFHGFMREQGLIRRSTKYTVYVDLNKTLSLMSELKERLSEAEARGDSLNQELKEKELQLQDMASQLAEAERKIKALEKNGDAREREVNDLTSKLSETSTTLSEAESKIRDLERQLKEQQSARSESGEPEPSHTL
jgi:chromosome segregation ATPase